MMTGRDKRKAKRVLQRVCLYVAVVLIVLTILLPYSWMVISSISTKAELLSKPVHFFPTHPTLQNYKDMIFGTGKTTGSAAQQFVMACKNSLIVSLAVTVISLFVGLFAAFSFSRYKFIGKDLSLNTILFVQMIPPIAILIPLYIVMLRLNMMDKLPTLIIVDLTFTLPFVIWIMKGYLDGIPVDLEESAMIDGCGRIGAFVKVILPIASTGLASTTIFAFIIAWNEFFFASNFTSTLAAKTLPVLITEFSSKFGSDFILTSTSGVMASLPPVLCALIFQKYIVSGLSSGAIKG